MTKDASDGGGRARDQRRSQHDLGYEPKGQVAPGRAKSAFQPSPEATEPSEPAGESADT